MCLVYFSNRKRYPNIRCRCGLDTVFMLGDKITHQKPLRCYGFLSSNCLKLERLGLRGKPILNLKRQNIDTNPIHLLVSMCLK